MAMEVVCGNCQGRLLVEHTGVVVACPHCNAHLQIGDPAAPLAPPEAAVPSPALPPPQFTPPPVAFEPPPVPRTPDAPPPPSSPAQRAEPDSWMPQLNLTLPPPTPTLTPTPTQIPAAAPESASDTPPEASTIMLPPSTSFEPAPSFQPAPGAANWQPQAIETPRAGETDIWRPSPAGGTALAETAHSSPDSTQAIEPPLPNYGDFNAGEVHVSSLPGAMAGTPDFQNAPAADRFRAATNSSGPAIVTSHEPRPATVPRYLFVIVASYASAVTLGIVILWIMGFIGTTSTLDLPDLLPAIDKKSGKAKLTLAPNAPLPLAYRLKLGESKRYGNLLVTPLKVTRGPLEFTHFLANGQTRPPTESPVLKLWVKFENVSSDQTFAALDDQLLFQRANDKEIVTQERSNNYVCQQSERKRIGKRVSVYGSSPNSEWLLKDQNLNTALKPSDAWQTYIPSNDEDLSSLQGPLTWRLQFRKGYNPHSQRGVTTLVEVEFDSQDVQSDS